MKHLFPLLALLCLQLQLSTSTSRAQSTGDFLFTKKTASGANTPVWLTPTSTNFIAFNGSGGLTTVSRSDYITTATAASTYQPLDSDLTSIAALTTTSFGRGLLDDADASAGRTTLGLGTLATQSATITDYLTTATAASTYQPLDADLTTIAGLADPNADRLVFWDDSAGAYAYLTAGTGLTISGTTITASGGGSGGHTIEEEGTPLTARTGLNFVGGGVTATDDSGNDETDVTVTRSGVYRTVWVPAAAMVPQTTSGAGVWSDETGTNDVNFDYLKFEHNTDKYAQVSVLLDNWDGGTIKTKIIWTATSGSGDIVFSVAATSSGDGEDIDSAFGTAQTVTDTYIGANKNQTTSATSAITVGGSPSADHLITLRLGRIGTDGADTFSTYSYPIGFWVQYKESATEPAIW